MSETIDTLPPVTATDPLDKGLRVAIAVSLPVLLFCGIYAAMQARFVARDTAALRDEIEALHVQVSKMQRPGAVGVAAVPSPRPTPPRQAKAKAKAAAADGEAPAKAGKRKAGKAKAAPDVEEAPPAREDEGRPRKKGAKARRGRKKKGAKAP